MDSREGAYGVVSGTDVVAHAQAARDDGDDVGDGQEEERHVQDVVGLDLLACGFWDVSKCATVGERLWSRGTLEDGNDEEVASYPKDERSDHNDGLLDVDVQVEGDHGEELPDAEYEHAQEAEELKQTCQLPFQRGGELCL